MAKCEHPAESRVLQVDAVVYYELSGDGVVDWQKSEVVDMIDKVVRCMSCGDFIGTVRYDEQQDQDVTVLDGPEPHAEALPERSL